MAGYAVVVTFTIGTLIATKNKIIPLILGLSLIALISGLILNIPVVKEAADAFALRWELAANSEVTNSDGGNLGVAQELFTGRILGQYTEPLIKKDSYPLIGKGIGLGSNIGAVRLLGSRQLTLSENSWGRQMDELVFFLAQVLLHGDYYLPILSSESH